MITIRGHHFLCMLTYIGKGYTEAFTANMTVVLQAIAAGEAFTSVDEPDSLCHPWIDECGPEGVHCFGDDKPAKDADALANVSQLLGCELPVGLTMALSRQDIEKLRNSFLVDQQARLACIDCQWNELCETVAASGFQGCVL
jgi:hypothetical protein